MQSVIHSGIFVPEPVSKDREKSDQKKMANNNKLERVGLHTHTHTRVYTHTHTILNHGPENSKLFQVVYVYSHSILYNALSYLDLSFFLASFFFRL